MSSQVAKSNSGSAGVHRPERDVADDDVSMVDGAAARAPSTILGVHVLAAGRFTDVVEGAVDGWVEVELGTSANATKSWPAASCFLLIRGRMHRQHVFSQPGSMSRLLRRVGRQPTTDANGWSQARFGCSRRAAAVCDAHDEQRSAHTAIQL